jgi:hypothetical protein
MHQLFDAGGFSSGGDAGCALGMNGIEFLAAALIENARSARSTAAVTENSLVRSA